MINWANFLRADSPHVTIVWVARERARSEEVTTCTDGADAVYPGTGKS
jgi:hypothetical protein